MKNVITTLVKSVFVPLGLTVAASATDATIQKKIFGLGLITLIFSNGELNDIMKIIKSLEDAGLLITGVTETAENEKKGQKWEFSGTLVPTLGANSLGNMLAGKGVLRAGEGTIRAEKCVLRETENTIRAGQDF